MSAKTKKHQGKHLTQPLATHDTSTAYALWLGAKGVLHLQQTHGTTVVFVRTGRFYRAFREDITTIERRCTVRTDERGVHDGHIPMLSLPCRAISQVIVRLTERGRIRVALVEGIGQSAVVYEQPELFAAASAAAPDDSRAEAIV